MKRTLLTIILGSAQRLLSLGDLLDTFLLGQCPSYVVAWTFLLMFVIPQIFCALMFYVYVFFTWLFKKNVL